MSVPDLFPGDLVSLVDGPGDVLPLWGEGEGPVNNLYGDEVAVVICVGIPPMGDVGPDVLAEIQPVYPYLLPAAGPMGWAHDPHLLVRL